MFTRGFISIAAVMAALMFLSFGLWAMGIANASKPGSPVSMSIETTGPASPKPGDVVELLVTVRSSLASDDVLVTLKLTGGAELLNPEPGWKPTKASWTLTLKKGAPKSRHVTVRFPEHTGGQVRARVALSDGAGGKYSARASIGTGPPAKKKQPDGKRALDSRGREIIEYRAE